MFCVVVRMCAAFVCLFSVIWAVMPDIKDT